MFKNILKLLFSFLLLVFIFNNSVEAKANISLKHLNTYEIKNPKYLGNGYYLGGYSDLFYYKGSLYAITDRGPNTNIKNNNNRDIRNFPLASNYHPFFIKFELKNNGLATVLESKNFNVTGLPVSEERDCVPCDVDDKEISFDPYGTDTESVIIDKNGHFWVGDEYFPSIIEFDKNLNVINRYAAKKTPFKNDGITCNLPCYLNKVQKNLGFESIAYDGDKYIYVFTQGTLDKGKFVKIIIFDIEKKKPIATYNYDIGTGKNIISATTFISKNEILTAERINGEHQIRLLKLKPFVINKSDKILSLKGINGIKNGQKIEGIAFDGKNKVFIINDNDFGIDDENRQDSFILEFELNKKNLN